MKTTRHAQHSPLIRAEAMYGLLTVTVTSQRLEMRVNLHISSHRIVQFWTSGVNARYLAPHLVTAALLFSAGVGLLAEPFPKATRVIGGLALSSCSLSLPYGELQHTAASHLVSTGSRTRVANFAMFTT